MQDLTGIPGNDDAIRAIQLFASLMADAVIEGRQGESYTAPKAKEIVAEQPVAEEAPAVEKLSPADALEKAIAEKESKN